MWILNFLPTWIAYAIALAGAVGLIASIFAGFLSRFIPSLVIVKFPLQIISIVVLAFGVYLWGGIANQEMWEARVNEMKKQVAIAEQKAKETNAKIEYKYVDKVKVIKDVQVVVQDKIKEAAVRLDSECKLSPDAVTLLNAAAKNVKPGAGK